MAIVSGVCCCASSVLGQGLTAYNFEVLHDNPRFYWTFNEAVPTSNAIDVVRKQANDQLVSLSGATRGAGLSANLGSAAVFNGANAFTASSLADNEMPSAWAIEMWAKADGSLAASRGDYLLNAGSGGGNNPAVIFDFTSPDNSIGLFSGGGRTDNQVGTPLISDNGWHHYVFTFYGNGSFGVADRVDVAVDGVVATIPRGGFSSGFNLQDALIVGAATTAFANGFQGQIDELAFYDLSSLTVAQVAARTQDIADHHALGSASEKTNLFIVDPGQITYSYTAGILPSGGNRADTAAGTLGGGKLINGVFASTNTGANNNDGSTVGYSDPPGDSGEPHPGIVFDLGENLRLEEIWIDYLGGNLAGIVAPDRLDVEFSDDGITFGGLLSFTNFNNSAVAGTSMSRRLIADVGGVNAEFVRLRFFNDQEWTFLSEVQFVASVPEPWSLAVWSIVGGGLLGVVGLRHRRKLRL
jgi:hypothetical protein